MNCKIDFSISVKKKTFGGFFIEIVLNMQVISGRTDILTILSSN